MNSLDIFIAVVCALLLAMVEDGQVKPLSYRGDDGTADTRRDVSVDFDWERLRVSGTAERAGALPVHRHRRIRRGTTQR